MDGPGGELLDVQAKLSDHVAGKAHGIGLVVNGK